jgi:hypothetical protein
MHLIDDRGRIVLSPVVETVQFRGERDLEFKFDHKDFAGGKPSLKAVGSEDLENDFANNLGNNVGSGRGIVLKTCFHCHQGGIQAVNSYGRLRPPLQFIKPRLMPSTKEEEDLRTITWKRDRYEWGLLQGLTLPASRE